MSEKDSGLSHIREDGSAAMVDVSGKAVTRRDAYASGRIQLQPETLDLIADGGMPKGDVLAVARIAGILAAKKTSDLIPLCHPLPISKISIDFDIEDDGIGIRCCVRTDSKTGVEMEALTGVSVAALTIYDMCKAVDTGMVIGEIGLDLKTKETLD